MTTRRSRPMILARFTMLAALLLALCIGLPRDRVDPASADDTNQRARVALMRVNAARAEAGAGPLTLDDAITRATLAHAQYLVMNGGESTHMQVPGRPGFTAVEFWDRLTLAGYTGEARGEVIAPYNEPVHALDVLLSMPYHRHLLIDPTVAVMGFGSAQLGGKTSGVANTGGRVGAPRLVHYPGRNAVGVPTSWDGGETPNPLPAGVKGPVGFTISLVMGAGATMQVSAATLRGPGGELVPVYQVPQLSYLDAYAVIPAAPLAESTTYTAHFVGTANGAAFDERWSFTTAQNPRAPWVSAQSTASGSFVTWAPQGGVAPTAYVIYRCLACSRGGAFERLRVVSAETTTLFDAPPLGTEVTYYVYALYRSAMSTYPNWSRALSGGNAPGYHSQWYSQSGYPELRVGETTTVWISFRNTGTSPWVRGVWGQQANLGLNLDDKTPYRLGMNVDWLWDDRIATTDAAVVPPGDIGQFNFKVRAPMQPGRYVLHVRPVVDGTAWMEDNGVFLIFVVR